jgi:hypothetical protein
MHDRVAGPEVPNKDKHGCAQVLLCQALLRLRTGEPCQS